LQNAECGKTPFENFAFHIPQSTPFLSRRYFPSIWTEVGVHVVKVLSSVRKDGKLCATRRYFPSGHFCSWCWLCHCKVL